MDAGGMRVLTFYVSVARALRVSPRARRSGVIRACQGCCVPTSDFVGLCPSLRGCWLACCAVCR